MAKFNVEVTGNNETSFVGTMMFLQERLVQTKGDCTWSVYIRPGIEDVMTNPCENVMFEEITGVPTRDLYNSLWSNNYTKMHSVTFVYEGITDGHVKTIMNFAAAMDLDFTCITKVKLAEE